MIARIWRGRTPAAKAEAYNAYLLKTGMTDYAATPGNQGVRLLRRIEGDEAEFLALTYWADMDAVRRFAGDRPEVAVYYPEDDDFLLEKEPHVAHYEILFTADPA